MSIGKLVYSFGGGAAEAPAGASDLVGGKGASLADMTRAGLNVPPGFTIAVECCGPVLRDGRWPDGLEEQVRAALARLEDMTGRRFGQSQRPLLVAVRSGAAASMPGMMDTILNCGLNLSLMPPEGPARERFCRDYGRLIRQYAQHVDGLAADVDAASLPRSSAQKRQDAASTAAQRALAEYERAMGKPFPQDPWRMLVACVNAVFRSWQTPRAVLYRQRHNLEHLAGTAVTVQAMVPADVAGVLFTQDATDVAAQRMVIEATPGLGEAVVSGEVTPDRYVVPREPMGAAAASETAAPRGCLAPADVRRIADLGLRIEKHFGKSMDVEWAFAGGDLFVLQCRPIKGLQLAAAAHEARQGEIARLKSLAAGERRVWVAHNLGETLRRPTPLTWDIIRSFMSGDGGFGRLHRDFGYRPSRTVCTDGFLELICGRIYTDPRRLAELFWEHMPLEYDPAAIAADPSALDRPPTVFVPARADGAFLLQLPGIAVSMIRSAGRIKSQARVARSRFESEVLPPYLEWVGAGRSCDLSALSVPELLAELAERRRRVLDEFGPESLRPGLLAALAMGRLERLLTQLLGQQRGARLLSQLTGGLEGDTTVEQNLCLARVAGGQMQFGEFIERFGHRCTDEMELAQPRWREQPEQVRAICQAMAVAKEGPVRIESLHAARVARRRNAEQMLPTILRRCGASSLLEGVRRNLAEVQGLLVYREAGKHYLMMGYELLRSAIVALGVRLGIGDDVFFLRLDELERAEASLPDADEIATRRLRWQALGSIELPTVIDSQRLDDLGNAPRLTGDGHMKGLPLSPGVATGVVRLAREPGDLADAGSGFILVCPSTDPSWTWLFGQAAALVVERGGTLSHGAIVARDFGLPAVACDGAMRLLRDGQRIRVSGNHGTIEILAEGQA